MSLPKHIRCKNDIVRALLFKKDKRAEYNRLGHHYGVWRFSCVKMISSKEKTVITITSPNTLQSTFYITDREVKMHKPTTSSFEQISFHELIKSIIQKRFNEKNVIKLIALSPQKWANLQQILPDAPQTFPAS